MKVYISDKTKDKLEQMIQSGKAGSISVRKYNPETDPITNVITGMKLEDSHRAKHKEGKYYTIYISKKRLDTYTGDGIMSWLPSIFKGVKAAANVIGGISNVVSSHKQNSEQARHNAEMERIARGEGLKCGMDGGFLGSIIPAIVSAVPAMFDIFSNLGKMVEGNGVQEGGFLGEVGNILGTVLGSLFGAGFDNKNITKIATDKMIKMHNSKKKYTYKKFGANIIPDLVRGIKRDQKYKGTYAGDWKDPFTYPLPPLSDEEKKIRMGTGTMVQEALPRTKMFDTPICRGAGCSCGCKKFIDDTPGIDNETKAKLKIIFRSLKPIYKIKQSGSAIYLSPR